MNSTSRFARPAVSRTASFALIAAVLLTASSLFSPFASRDVSSCASSFFPPFAASIVSAADDVPEKLRTVAERSNFAATSRHAEVEALGRALAESSPLVRYLEFGETVEGRKLPLLVVAEPPVASPDEAAKTDKAVVLVFANIHGGEVDGKEGVLMFVRDLVRAAERPLLKDVVLLVVPNLNADGNERFALDNRPEQDGPAQGMGVRENAQGLDLNRDYIKLETPEIRALVRLVQQWNPPLVLDCHTTNGAWHRHTMTYDVNRHPGSDPRLIKLAQQQLVPHVDRRLEELGGWKGFYYGNFAREHTVWETFPLQPRFGTHYFALRQRVAVLAESYSHASYKDRCLASRDMVRAVVEFAASHKKPLRETVEAASRDAAVDSSARRSNDGGKVKEKENEKEPAQHRQVPLRVAPTARDGKFVVLGWEERDENGKSKPTDKPKEYPVTFMGGAETKLAVARPFAYLIPAKYKAASETLQRHGIVVEELREDVELDVETYHIKKVVRADKEFQKHRAVTIEAEPRAEARRVPAGTYIVKTAAPLGDLATYLLEPLAEDGLAAWNFFDGTSDGARTGSDSPEKLDLVEGADFPVLRLPGHAPLLTARRPPPPELRTTGKRITMDNMGGVNLNGAQGGRVEWLDDEHFLQSREGRMWKIHALTGRATPHQILSEKVAGALGALPTIGPKRAAEIARGMFFNFNADRSAFVFEHENDLYYAKTDGSHAARLTSSPQREELATFSPDGRFVAFVRGLNLYVVDLPTATERQLTTDGGGRVQNGKADWVYFEEVFNRNWQTYWWSPDSQRITFLRIDDGPVHDFTVVDPVPARQPTEVTPYPKAGDPLPLVKVGCVTVAGGEPVWARLDDYSPHEMIVSRAGFTPDGQHAYAYVLNRQQTWLDFVQIDARSGAVQRLFRETTKAWVDDHGPPVYLKDRSFLFISERDGYRHLYRYQSDGKLIGQVTKGAWEMRGVPRLDDKQEWVYFSGTKDGWIGSNYYRASLAADASPEKVERLTDGVGTHVTTINSRSSHFVDNHGSRRGPSQTHLRSLDGSTVRTLDSNPVPAIEEYVLGKMEPLEIPTPDGFILEGLLIYPPDFHAEKKYPLWVKTYGGPHAATVRDTWHGGHVEDQAHASAGFMVLHVDPRPASAKGAVATWTAYKQLGKQELTDLESAVQWLGKRPYIDLQRVGLSGYSYGGYLTSYALTHSKVFAAGVAGAPVTDWRNYDAIYTERYMDTPQNNPDGYHASSVVAAAKNLHGKLLLVHGVMDDNVHVQNSLQLLGALQDADKYVETQFYPRARHGVPGRHLSKLSFDFMSRHLKPTP